MDPIHRYPGRLPLTRRCSCACRCSLSPGKILPHRTVRLTKLPQGKQCITDHIRPGLFIGSRYGSPAFRCRPRVKKPERYPDVILFPKAGSGAACCFCVAATEVSGIIGFLSQSLYVVIKRAGRDPVLNTPLTIRKSAGSTLADQF